MKPAEVVHDYQRNANSIDSEKIAELILLERTVPVIVNNTDFSIRAKITDSCGMTCTFCHNEGTPVANSVQRRNGRVSIYSETNGVSFTPGELVANDQLFETLIYFKVALGATELHLTGGEPTLAKNIVKITELATKLGLVVKVTSNGETGSRFIPVLAQAGVSSINYSIFGTTPGELAAVQAPRFQNPRFGSRKLAALEDAINSSSAHGIDVKANVVVPDLDHTERVHRIREQYGDRVKLRLLTSLDSGLESPYAIYSILAELKAEPVKRYITTGSSGMRVDYKLPSGEIIGFKQIKRAILPSVCGACNLNNDQDCHEGIYGLRLFIDQTGQMLIGICIQRMDLTLNLQQFKSSGLVEEIEHQRRSHLISLQEEYGSTLYII